MREPTRAPFANFVGGGIEEQRDGYVRLAVDTTLEHADVLGRVHSGVITTLMDSAIGIALGHLRGEPGGRKGGPHATIDMSASFYAHAEPGEEIVVEGRVTRIQEGAAFGEAKAQRASDGELLASGRLTFAIPRHAEFRKLEG